MHLEYFSTMQLLFYCKTIFVAKKSQFELSKFKGKVSYKSMIEVKECINEVRCLSEQDLYHAFLYRDIIDADLSKSNNTMITEDMVI